jgi:uncharacterized Zn-binding protein involved in type VI secretion
MGKPVAARIVSRTSHDGYAFEGASKTKMGPTRMGAHRIGDGAICPLHGPIRLMTGVSNVIIEGKPVGTIDSIYRPVCLAKVTTGVNNIIVG